MKLSKNTSKKPHRSFLKSPSRPTLTRAAIVLSACFVLGLSGCAGQGSLKYRILRGYDHLLLYFSQQALTDDKDLQGTKTPGEDSYTGTYKASYDGFSGKEYLFGGTALHHGADRHLDITYTLTVTSGEAQLSWNEKQEIHTIARDTHNGTYTLSLSDGDNYIVLEGKDFTGTLEMTIE